MKFEERAPAVASEEAAAPELELDLEEAAACELAMIERASLDAAAAHEPGAVSALRARLDDLRGLPERRTDLDPAEPQHGLVLDFLADPSPAVDTADHPPAGADDADFFFSAARRRSLEAEGIRASGVAAAGREADRRPRSGRARTER